RGSPPRRHRQRPKTHHWRQEQGPLASPSEPKGREEMIRAHFGLDQNPFSRQGLTLLSQQQEMFDTLRVHCPQGGLRTVVGYAGTGKSIVKQDRKSTRLN